MKTKAISIINKFKCLGAECPNTCCRNWNVSVDEITYENYKKAPGLKKYSLIASTKRLKGFHVMRTIPFQGCIYHRKGLCRFQCENHMEWMPEICRVYPRRIIEMGELREMTVELSCVEMARIFIENPGRLHFRDCEEMKPQWVLENRDEKFEEYLLKSRDKILDFLWRDTDSEKHLVSDMFAIYRFCFDQHNRLMRNGLDDMLCDSSKVDIGSFWEEKKRVLFYPASVMNDVIYEHLWYTMIPFRNPYLYRSLKAYDHQFGSVLYQDADACMNQKMERLLQEVSELKYRSYLSYCIQELYLECYEDYYLIGKILLIFLYLQGLMIFDLAMFLENGSLPLSMQAEILSGTEKGMRHSLGSERQFLEKIRTDFMNSDK